MFRPICFAIALVLCADCAQAGDDAKNAGVRIWSPPRAKSEVACKKLGGHWFRSRAGARLCDVPTSDAGKQCRDSSACESYCVAPNDFKASAKVMGQCAEWHYPFGRCFNEVKAGIASGALCVD